MRKTLEHINTSLLPDWFFKTGTGEQVDVIEAVHQPNFKNLVVEALAGCGKTTLLEMIIATLPPRSNILFTSFSKEVVGSFEKKEIRMDDSSRLTCQGIHSLGLRAIRKNLRKHLIWNRVVGNEYAANQIMKSVYSKDYVDPDKYKKILQRYWDTYKEQMFAEMDPEKLKEVDFVQVRRNVMRLVNLGRLYTKTKVKDLDRLALDMGIIQEGEGDLKESHLARLVILDGLGKTKASDLETIDFTDMLWLPYAMDRMGHHRKAKRNEGYYLWEFPYYEYILVDECQDLSTLQLDLIRKMNPKHQISVGDPNQAIYGFAGSDYKSFHNITQIPGTQVLPLTVNFRSTEKIGDAVRELVPEFKTAQVCEEGEDPSTSTFTDIKVGDCIIARNNKPLIELYFEIMKLSLTTKTWLPVFIKGAVFDGAEEAIAKKASDVAGTQLTSSVVKQIRKMREEGIDRLSKHGVDAKDAAGTSDMQKLEMLADSLEVVSRVNPSVAKTYKNAFKEIKMLTLKPSVKSVCLCTAHRSKGLEFDRVHIYGRGDFMKEKDGSTAEQIRQEKNLYYVALSRAKKKLMFLDPKNTWDLQSVKEDKPSLGKYGDNLDEII